MSQVPQYQIKRAIVEGWQDYAMTPARIYQLFAELDRDAQEDIQRFVRTGEIKIDVGYPKGQVAVPSITIILSGDDETDAFLGNITRSGGTPDSTPPEHSYDRGPVETTPGVASASGLAGPGRRIVDPTRAIGGTRTTIQVAEDLWWPGQLQRNPAAVVGIIAGRGAGQIRPLKSHTAKELEVAIAWDVAPDVTTVFEVRDQAAAFAGEPALIYEADSGSEYETLGTFDTTELQLQVLHTTPDMTAFIATLLKAILLEKRRVLGARGIHNMRVRRSDLTPRPEYVPDDAYLQSLNVSFRNMFEVVTEIAVGSSFELAPRTQDTGAPTTVLLGDLGAEEPTIGS